MPNNYYWNMGYLDGSYNRDVQSCVIQDYGEEERTRYFAGYRCGVRSQNKVKRGLIYSDLINTLNQLTNSIERDKKELKQL